jgi:adenosylcobinamide-GDP ribazoletransferase
MEVNIDRTHWYDRLYAAFIFFTRLPFWRLHQPPKECYKAVVEFWPLTGWLTGGAMAAALYFGSWYLPYSVAVIGAIAVRMLLTGALHEDGLADFFDGFGGGGTNRERILTIMKDSHIGTYGVLSLILYLALLYLCLQSMTPTMAAMTVLVADPLAKMLSASITQLMPYARNEETSKAHTVYRRMSIPAALLLAAQGLLPLGIYILMYRDFIDWELLLLVPCITIILLYRLIKHRLQGYTGDCCGACCLLVELSIYLSYSISL